MGKYIYFTIITIFPNVGTRRMVGHPQLVVGLISTRYEPSRYEYKALADTRSICCRETMCQKNPQLCVISFILLYTKSV